MTRTAIAQRLFEMDLRLFERIFRRAHGRPLETAVTLVSRSADGPLYGIIALIAAVAGGPSGRLFALAVGERDRRTATGQRLDNGATDAARSASDQRDPARQGKRFVRHATSLAAPGRHRRRNSL